MGFEIEMKSAKAFLVFTEELLWVVLLDMQFVVLITGF